MSALRADDLPSLAAALIHPADFDEEELDLPEEERRWEITGTATATWAMARLSDVARKEQQIRQDAQDLRDQINQWEADQLRKPTRDRNFFEGQLVEYARKWRAEDPKHNKTLKLVTGSVETKERKNPTLKMPTDSTGKELLANWMRDYALEMDEDAIEEGYIRVKCEAVAAKVKSIVEAAYMPESDLWLAHLEGQPVPGVTVEGPGITYRVVVD